MNLIQQLTLQHTQDNIMACFAEIDEETYQVLNVVVVPDEQEHRGQEYLAQDCGLGGMWVQTSSNTRAGTHYYYGTFVPSGKPAFRKNYAKIGGYYDPVADAFHAAKPVEYPSFILDPDTFTWKPPVPMPTELPEGLESDNYVYIWNESELIWVLQETPQLITVFDVENNPEMLAELDRKYKEKLEQENNQENN
jgi:hypothetical protein